MAITATKRRLRAIATTSWLALGIGMACATGAAAQTASGEPAAGTSENTVSDVVVVGARASQQSSIDRKKRAATPTDSIVADDVGSFPDRNINEAISRISGVALNRNEYGEGSSVSIRGNGPEFTRVELDGIGVQSTTGSFAGGDTGSGRGADMRELPADLIKSVDIIKGSTADMTEGSLGGSIKIQTRSGLDFKKPYLTMRLGGQYNDQDEKTTYDHNFVAASQFLDGRLGVILSASASNTQKTSSKVQNVTSANSGYALLADFDNSADKTFEFNPDIMRGGTADTVLANSLYTPREILARSAQAQSKADCETLFPVIDNPFGTSLAANQSNTLRDQKRQRIDEQLTCLNQWNDYTPSLQRNFINSEGDKKLAVDLRFDFRVTDNLKVYAKYAIANRDSNSQQRTETFGGVGINPGGSSSANYINNNPASCAVAFNALAGQFNPGDPFYLAPLTNPNRCAQPGTAAGPAGQAAVAADRNYRRGVVANGYYTINPNQVTGRGEIDILPGTGSASFTFPIYGSAINVDPSTVVVDANHHVTEFELSNGVYGVDQLSNYRETESSYMQVGGEYWEGPLRIEFVANRSQSEYRKNDYRTSRSYDYGVALGAAGRTRATVSESGIWNYEMPDGFDPSAIENYTQLAERLPAQVPGTPTFFDPNAATRPTYTAAQRALVSNMFAQQYSPAIEEGEETAVKFDLTYDLEDKSPFLKRLKTGVSYRNELRDVWRGGGKTITPERGTFGQPGYVAPVILPSNQIRAGYRACEARGPASQGFEQCDYGSFVRTGNVSGTTLDPSYNIYSFSGITTFTRADLNALLEANLEPPVAGYFVGYPGAPASPGFTGINVNGVFSQTGIAPYLNYDCMKVCTASDGKVYEQPRFSSDETIIASYAMLDFGADMPLGMALEGNVGIRRVQKTTQGDGNFTFTSILRRPTATDPNATVTYSRTQQFAIDHTSITFLPSYNLALWVVPDKVVVRGYTAKTISPPPIGRLVPTGTCTYDERLIGLEDESVEGEGLADLSCSRQGNPDLKPYTANDYNLSVEWYPNRDTTFSLAWHKLDVKVGGPTEITRNNYRLFEGTNEVDPETGVALSDLEFSLPTYTNGPGFERTGLEFQAKTAFTFLPGLLRYTGADFNYSKLKAANAEAYRDPLTGEGQKPQGQSDYFANLSLWYDDGQTQARVTYQARGESFLGISGLTNNNVNNPPIGNLGENLRQPYLLGEPFYQQETAYVDAKISHKLTPNIELYLEGRNLTREADVTAGSPNRAFENGNNLWQLAYGGRRFMAGVVFRFGGN